MRALESLPLFHNLTVLELARVAQVLETRSHPARREILKLGQQGIGVQILLNGSVKVFIRRPTGAQMILAFLGRGEILGEISSCDGQPHSAGVTTLEPTQCLYMKSAIFCELAQTLPTLSFNLAQLLTRRLRRLTGHTEALATLDVTGRIAYQLLFLSYEYGCACPEGTLIPLRLTQSDLASLCGASREKVNRVMQRFRIQRYIALNGDQHILIRNKDALFKLCQ